jgi:hypothetical protein
MASEVGQTVTSAAQPPVDTAPPAVQAADPMAPQVPF